MTENRLFAVRARILAGLFALAGLIGLTGCGGGSGAPNNPFSNPGDLAVNPPLLTAYGLTPATVTIAGGHPPYTIVSSDQSALPVPFDVAGSSLTVVPNNVSAVTAVTLTARDSFGTSAQSTVTINPAPLENALTITADNYSSSCPGGSSAGGSTATTFICAGQTGSVSVRIANAIGGGTAGRLVRFDVIQGAFQFFTELPGQTPSFALTETVPTDLTGTAVARFRANPGAPQQIAIVQATDVGTGAFVRATFVIVSTNNANATDLVVIPTNVNITGPDNQTCSSGVASTFYIFGGSPPYTIVSGFPQALLISPTVVQTEGAGFTATTTGFCVDPDTIVITDSAGHTVSVTLHNVLGTNAPPTTTSPIPITVVPSTLPPLACGVPNVIIVSGGGTVATTGNNQVITPASSLAIAVSRPDVVSALPTSGAPPVSVSLTRVAPGPNSPPANVSLFISDGKQPTKTVNIPIDPTAPCPVGP